MTAPSVPMQNPTLETLALALQTQRDYFDSKLDASSEALRVALHANDVRLNGMNEFRESLNDTTSKMMSRVEAIATIQAVDARNIAEVATLREKLEVMQRPNYVTLASMASVLFVIITGIWVVIGLKIDTSSTPTILAISELRGKQALHDQQITDAEGERRRMSVIVIEGQGFAIQSKSDRDQLNIRMRDVERAQDTALLNRSVALSSINSEFARINTWMTFAHHTLFPVQPFPQQTPIPTK